MKAAKIALLVGVVATAVCTVGAFFDFREFLRAWLLAYLFWLGIPLGSVALILLHVLVGGRWGLLAGPPLQAAARTTPLLAAAFVPLALAMRFLYRWTDPSLHEPLGNRSYLNVPFFLVRLVLYFAIWIGMVALIRRRRVLTEGFASAALIVYVVTMTFASFDWIMSLEAHWWSTVFSMLVITGQGLAAMAFVIAVAAFTNAPDVDDTAYHDLGNLLLMFVMLWSYMAFSQFLVIWAGNLPDEIRWYLPRLHTDWRVLALLLVAFYFAAPFFFLLFRAAKRTGKFLGAIALLILAMRLVDLYWIVGPSFHPGGFVLHWMDVVAPVGIGGVWLAYFLHNLARPEALRA